MSRFRMFDLNPEQHTAATHGNGPLLILAGAGTGKTRVITARIAWLIAQGHAPSRILAVTFTNKAAKEMKTRVLEMIEVEKGKEVTISTFHSLCVRILRQSASLLGYKDNFTILDDADQSGLLKKIIQRTAASDEKLEPALARALISKAKNSGIGGASFLPTEETLIGAVYSRYQQELKNLNAMDFDDLLVLAVRVLREYAAPRAQWQNRYEFFLIDEFQDTNRLQLELISLLIGKSANVCVVGDDDQSIYGWRGAEVSNILEFERHFPDPLVIKLEQNYRSTPAILSVANRLIRNNVHRRGKNLWSAAGEGSPIHILTMRNEREEAEFVVSEIAAQRYQTPLEHFAVLYRTNQQSRPIEEALRKLKIPYRLIGGKSFFERREVKDVLAYAACLINPANDVALLRIIRTPPRGIGAVTVEHALAESIRRNCSLFAALQAPDPIPSLRTQQAIAQFCDLMESFQIRLSTPGSHPSGLLQNLLEESGYFQDLSRSCKTPAENLRREENVRDLLRDLSKYQGLQGLRTFLDEVTLDYDREEKEESTTGVTLITLHAVKGLEFPHVYLIGVEDGLLPHKHAKNEGTLDEERRLLYVGITRAMKTLTISHSLQRIKYGSPVACQPSPFLQEIVGEGVVKSSGAAILNRPAPQKIAEDHFAQLKQMIASG